MPSNTLLYVAAGLVCLACIPSVSAFGSGNIPNAAYLKGKAWRHGEIEDTLESLAKVAGHGGAAVLGAIASAFFGGEGGGGGQHGRRGLGGKKFTGLDIKRVYFGNWLRDMSQVCDIAGFKAMTADSLVIVVMIMAFMSFGYATGEFEVTKERLAVYLLTEHIDNPKGYGEGEDARTYDSRLRPPVENRELEIDERNGMKKYIATEGEGYDTSTDCIRRTFQRCIQLGREAQREGNKEKEYEAYRLLGTGLHTLEDFPAHSNYCELALQKLGHSQVFAHVGDNVKVRSPSGDVPPCVTGTFGGADFMHSMLGEAGDKLSQSSIVDLTAQLDQAQAHNQQDAGGKLAAIKALMSRLPSGGGDDATNKLDEIDQKKQGFNLDGSIDSVAPDEVQKQLWEIFKLRDDIMRQIETTIEGIPGLSELLENISTSLSEFVMLQVDAFARPFLIQAASAIGEGSKAVISGEDQWTVFTDDNASDPTHSVIAKDHFGNILNEPAGNVSVIIVRHTVNAIVQAWAGEDDENRVIDGILEALHHPAFANGQSSVQTEMIEYMQKWIDEMDSEEKEKTLNSLTKDGVRNHRNQRKTSDEQADPRIGGGVDLHNHGGGGYGGESQPSQQSSGYGQQSSGYGQQSSGYGQQQPQHSGYNTGYDQQQSSGYNQQPSSGYNASYGGQQTSSYGQQESESTGYGRSGGGYGSSTTQQSSGYGQETSSYGRSDNNESSYGRNNNDDNNNRFGGERREHEGRHGGGRQHQEEERRHSGEHHGGRRHQDNDNDGEHGGGRRHHDNDNEGGYGGGGRRHGNDDGERHGGGGHGRRGSDNEGGRGDYGMGRLNMDDNRGGGGYGGPSGGFGQDDGESQYERRTEERGW